MRTPNLNSLKMFDAAARHLSFRAAADELNLTQGAVAQQVRRLEADLAVRLVSRKARGLELTDVGRNYHVPIRRALAMIESATQKFRTDGPRVTISVTPSFASKWLVPRLSSFARLYPDIEVQTIASEELANFKSDGVDLAIRQGRPAVGSGLVFELFAPLDLCAVCSPNYAEEAGPIRELSDFTNLQLIQDSHTHWETLMEEAGLVARHRLLRFNQTALAMDAAANGQGVALAPRLLTTADLAAGKLVNLWQDRRQDQIGYYLVYPDKSPVNPARDALLNWIVSEATDAA